MAIFSGAAVLISVSMSWVVAIRLFLLSRRTGGEPERMLAMAFGASFCLGFPLAAISRAPGLVGTHPGTAIFGLAIGLLMFGLALLYRFPQRVFRPTARWAIALVRIAYVAAATIAVGMTHAIFGVSELQAMIANLKPWAIAMLLMAGLPFAWNAVESARYYHAMRRRVRLGLADPATAQRILLWAIGSIASFAQVTTVLILRLAGLPIVGQISMTVIALGAIVASICWYLAFLPPRWLRVAPADMSSSASAM